ncbi:MAG: ABC transporter permease [Verrucomicrobia bacterium]|nr:ABC transporter permease [Verrucomicrobiota bacterium]
MNTVWSLAKVVVLEMVRRKDFYVLFILTVLLTGTAGSVNLFNDRSIVRYLKEICLLLIWLSGLIIAITCTARQIPAEREHRTIFPLLAKPVTRGQFLLGKFLGCWVATGMALVLFYLLFGLVSGSRDHQWPVLNYLQAAWLHWMMLGIVIAFTLLGSIVFAAPSSNGTISFACAAGMLLLGRHLNKVALSVAEPLQSLLYTAYFILPHLELFDVRELIIHDAGLIRWDMVTLATLYAAAYGAFFLFGAWLAFRRRPLN